MWLPRLGEVLPAIEELVAPRLLVGLVSRRLASNEMCPPALRDGAVLAGQEEIEEREAGGLPFLEAGLRFEAHPREGHKTGFYLDQRENRGRLEAGAGGARVLDVFSHTGGFALHAARGGAREVVSVDASGPALAQGERHFELNGAAVASTRHTTLQGDAFETMDRLRTEGRRFDIVVVDPPSFAKAEAQREGALDAYEALTRLALGVLEPGGLLVQASCSSRVPAEEFYAAVHRAARSERRDLVEEERTEHPPDHPVTFPEGAYLSCLFARAW